MPQLTPPASAHTLLAVGRCLLPAETLRLRHASESSEEEALMASEPTTSESSLASLSWDECLALLRQGCVGRLAVVIQGQPHILPLNYAADENGVIVFRTADLTAATEAVLINVAFEIDEIDLAGDKDGVLPCMGSETRSPTPSTVSQSDFFKCRSTPGLRANATDG